MRNSRASLAAVAGLALAAGLGSSAAQAQPADVAAGADVFQDRCSECHVPNGVGQGPNLVGVVGRKAGTVHGFDYTPALKASGLTWTPANIDRFLSGPGKLVPGTAMSIVVANPVDRRQVIAYLASLPGQ